MIDPPDALMFDFAALPPEINSTRMYSGPGSGPMMAAAAGWDALATQLELFANGYSSIITELQTRVWTGPSATAMVAAASKYVRWATVTSMQAEHAANLARFAAAAYEAAHAATVPPAVVAANRAQLAVLVATNFFGQNTPAIAANEAAYAGMWAQDAAAMYGYAAASQPAAALTPFDEAPQTTARSAENPQKTQPPPTPILAEENGLFDYMGVSNSSVSRLVDGMHTVDQTGLQPFSSLAHWMPKTASVMASTPSKPLLVAAIPGSAGAGLRQAVTVRAAQANLVGKLSVPQGWSSAMPANAAQAAQLPVTAPRVAGVPDWFRPMGGHALPPIIPTGEGRGKRRGTPVFRMRDDRRFRFPRPKAVG